MWVTDLQINRADGPNILWPLAHWGEITSDLPRAQPFGQRPSGLEIPSDQQNITSGERNLAPQTLRRRGPTYTVQTVS